MKTKELIEYLDSIRDCIDDLWGDIAYMEENNEEEKTRVLDNLLGCSLMIDSLVSRIESEDSKK